MIRRLVVVAALLMTTASARATRAQNVLVNPRFATGIEGWTPQIPIGVVGTFGWDAAQASEGVGGSGVMSVPVGILGGVGASQCVSLPAGVVYDWGGDVRTEAPGGGTWFLQLVFHSGDGCTGLELDNASFAIYASESMSRWTRAAGPPTLAPAGTRSALLDVELFTLGDNLQHLGHIDNVYLGRRGTVPESLIPEVPALSVNGKVLAAVFVALASIRALASRRSKSKLVIRDATDPRA